MTDTNKKFNQNSQTKETILEQNELSEGIGCFETFIEKYAEKSAGFPYACFFISTDRITSQTIANFVNGGAKLLKKINNVNFCKEGDETTFKQIATKIGQLIVNGKIKLDSFTSQELANTFNGLAKCGVNLGEYFETKKDEKDAFIGTLVGRIQTLLEQEQFTSQHIANTFNGLAKCGVNLGEYLNTLKSEDKNKFIGALVGKIQNLLKDFNSIGIANTFNGLAKCGVNLGEYFETKKDEKDAFIGTLVGKIQNLLKDFNSIGIANTFNGLGQCGVNLGGYVKDKFIGALVSRIQVLLNKKDSQIRFNFKSQELANTFNGLAKCGVNLGEYLNSLNPKDKNKFIGALVGRIQTLLEQKQFTSQHIANTFNGLGQCGINLGGYVNDDFIGALVGRIQTLLEQEQFTSQHIANTFNGLGQCGVNLGGYVNDDFIGALVGRIQTLLEQEQFTSQHIANTFNGLGQSGVNLGGYVNDAFIKTLVGKIQNLLSTSNFNSIGIANTFNGLGQCGVNLGKYFETKENEKNAFIRALVGKIQTLLPTSDFNSIGIANTFNGLVKLFLYNEDLYKKNISHFKDIINNLVQKYFKQSNINNQSDWTMLYNIKYLQVYGFKIDEEILPEITNLKPSYLNDDHTLKLDALNDDHTNSTLERNFETFLGNFGLKNKKTETLERKDDCYESESELTFQVTSHVSFKRLIDFYIEFIQDNKTYNKTYKAYIELDGPSHFTDIKQTQKTPQTQIRDILTLKRLQEEQADDNTQILYVTLSAKEFDKIKKNKKTKEDLLDFLTEKNQLKQITEKTSDTSKMVDEDKLAHSSVNGVASKTMDIDDYTTLTPRQAVSELAQKAQQEEQEQQKQYTFKLNAQPFVPHKLKSNDKQL